MHFRLPATALTIFGLLASPTNAVPAGHEHYTTDDHPTTTTSSASCATSSAAAGGVSGLLNDILTVGLAGTRPFLVYPPFGDDAILAAASQPTPTSSATPGAQTSISDAQTVCSYTITPGQCVPVYYPPGFQEALETGWEIIKYIFPFFFVATDPSANPGSLPALNDTTVDEILSSASACAPGPTVTGFLW
ncbi:hypothetical protein NCC49_004582 [Naganishia albida]|nr:hypothetical protein NCC49_004582 [Naganishia albida]